MIQVSEGHLLYACLVAAIAGAIYGWGKTTPKSSSWHVAENWPAVIRLHLAGGVFVIGLSGAEYGGWWLYGLAAVGAAKAADLITRSLIEGLRFLRE